MIYNLTHYDLDGVVSSIVLSKVIKNINIITTGYNAVNTKIKPFISEYKRSVISDIDIDEDTYKQLIQSDNDILYIDHHKKNYDVKSVNKLKAYVNEKYCASADILSFFKDKYSFDDNIKKLVRYTNDYDMWLLKTKESRILNFLFWKYGFNNFYEMFKDGYNNDIVVSHETEYDFEQLKIKEYVRKCDKYEVDENCGYNVLFIYCDKYINDVTLVYPDYDYYFIVSEPYKMSVRNKTNVSLEVAFNQIKKLKYIETSGCHDFAGGINISKDCDNLTDFYIEIVNTVMEFSLPF